MGSDKRRADVVLMNSKGDLAAIAECKRPGVDGNGIDQLKSYLSATDTPFGIFANSTEPDSWNFYENLGRNRFREVTTRSEFEKRVIKIGKDFSNYNVKFLMVEITHRHMLDLEIVQEYWQTWLKSMGITDSQFLPTQDDPQMVIEKIKEFILTQ